MRSSDLNCLLKPNGIFACRRSLWATEFELLARGWTFWGLSRCWAIPVALLRWVASLRSAVFRLPPRLCAACDADCGAGAPNFGTIFASLVTQVAVGDVYSAQRATRGSATVGVCAGGRKPVY